MVEERQIGRERDGGQKGERREKERREKIKERWKRVGSNFMR